VRSQRTVGDAQDLRKSSISMQVENGDLLDSQSSRTSAEKGQRGGETEATGPVQNQKKVRIRK
jgi:hypothetical protein